MFKIINSKEFKNVGWLVCGRIIQMILSLFVGVLTARYLGPANYGLINYGTAYVTFFMSLCTLGINSVIVKEFIDNPDEQGTAIGTTLVLRVVSSVFSAIMIIGISGFINQKEPDTIIVVSLCSIALVFNIFEILNYWFQSQYKSKVTAIATLVAYIATSIYRVILLIFGASVYWFAFATSIDYIVLGLFLFICYKQYNGPAFAFSWMKAKFLFKSSYHYILSGMMVAVYGQTDKLMLKQMLDDTSVGYYAAATAISTMWVFVLQAIIDSVYPTIMKLYKKDYLQFERKNRQLYAIVFYISIFVSLAFILIGDVAIQILYGKQYAPAGMPLKIITWYVAFSYLGVARNAWIVCENKQHYLKYMYLSAAIINVILNLILIPVWGAAGAAAASLITQIFTSIILPLFFKDMRRNSVLMLQAITLKGVFNK